MPTQPHSDIGFARIRSSIDGRRSASEAGRSDGMRRGAPMNQPINKTEQAVKAELFRAMHSGPHLLLLPNAWDAISARIVVEAGFHAIATTSGGVAWTLGYKDGEAAPWDEVVAATARIARAVVMPVTADIETGYGDTPEAVGRSI